VLPSVFVHTDPKIRIYDSGMKRYGVDAFPHCTHLVRCVTLTTVAAGGAAGRGAAREEP
jgi:large subunit ribosomal protein L10e